MRKRLRAAVPALVLAALSALAADAPARLAGKVAKVGEGGATFELRAKGGPFDVVVPEEAIVLVHRFRPLREVEPGAKLHVLARRQEAQTDPKTGGQIGPHLTSVQAIVAGEPFSPPDVPADLREKGLAWFSGEGSKQAGGDFALPSGGAVLWGPDRPVIIVEKGTPASIAKNGAVLVEGTAVDGDGTDGKKTKRLRATQISVLHPGVPAAEYRLAFGL